MTVTIPHDIQSSDCQRVSQVLARVGEKWSILIVMTLASHPHRFSEIKRRINGISQRMLTLCLRGLEQLQQSKAKLHETVVLDENMQLAF
ncbi:winged helix-turn-helix transcriptional regulator, partial [Acinetobacter baumannii]